MIERVNVIGRGRVGSAVTARLQERGLALDETDPELVLLCVPDRAIGEAAAYVSPGPWVAHVSGATPLAELAPHTRRFSVHPLQTFTVRRGAEQLDGAWGAVTAETEEARLVATWLAETLGLRPFPLADVDRATYHAGAAIASNYLVTLRRAAGSLLESRRSSTGSTRPADAADDRQRLRADRADPAGRLGDGRAAPRGDPRGAARARAPLRRPRRCDGGGRVNTYRTIADVRAALEPRLEGTIGLVPTMGALHAGHLALIAAARAECSTVVMSLFVNPTQFGAAADLAAYPRDEAEDLAAAAEAGVDLVFAPTVEEMYPQGFQTWVEVSELGSILEGEHRPGHFRGVATVCLKLFSIVRPDLVYFGQKDAQQVAVLRRMISDLALDIGLRDLPTVRDADGLALSSRNSRLSAAERERALALPRALATRDPERARELLDGLEVDYVEIAPFDPPVLAAAIHVGSTRLIDNVPLEEAS